MDRWTSDDRFRVAVATALAAVGLLAACGKRPTGPGEIQPFRVAISGWVRDTAGTPLPDVSVNVVEGAGLVPPAMTDASGHFAMSVVYSDTMSVRASKDGYVTQTRKPVASGGGFFVLFEMESTTPSANMTGEYALSFTANETCTQLPSVARTRTYRAVITPSPNSGPYSYDVMLSGARFYPYRNHFFIRVAGSFARFLLADDWYDPIVEELTPSTYVFFNGVADATVDASVVSTPFNGAISFCSGSADPDECVEPVRCWSLNHRLTLTRR